MPSTGLGRRLGNKLYKVAFPLYRPLYSAFKAYADRAERQLLASNLSPGCIVVDAGANIGVYSRFLSKCVGPSGVVHSFEPAPDNFARLCTAVTDLSNVRPNQLAVSDQTREQLLYISDDLNVDHRAYQTEGEPRRTVCIRATALDDYFKPAQRVDLIKIDIQGYELHALQGAERVLRDNRDVKLLLEFWPYGLRKAGASPEELLSFLRRGGFTLFLSQGGEWVKYDDAVIADFDPSNYFNLFAQRNRKG